MTLEEAKAMMQRDIFEMMRLTRLLLKPGSNVDAIEKKLDALMVPLAKRIKEMGHEAVTRKAMDELVLEEMQLHYAQAKEVIEKDA